MQDNAITGILYVAFGLVALVTLGKNDVPNIRQHPDNSAVRVAVALNAPDDGPTQADGTYPAILAYNEVGDYIGWSDWQHRPHIKSGGFHDVIIEQQKGPGQQATYLQLFAGTDAVCIAYISQTWADGTTRGWLGDMGRACGRPYYYSHIFVGNDGHVPDCIWMDADHSDDPDHDMPAALQIHMQEYTNLTTAYSRDPAHYCDEECIIFHRDPTKHLDFKKHPPKEDRLFRGNHPPGGPCCMDDDDGYAKRNRQRQQPRNRRPPALAARLVSSPHGKHSATDLCGSELSHGPDFVSWSERVFCDMGTKVSWPLCGSGGSVGGEEGEGECYEWETHSLVTGGRKVARHYATVEEWG
ncbi:hypothetical protein HO173_006445 [Letharia columbiana]|uniref:Uncharacterized protein n=1 Tax=Letharia columbiana TaxID=112416 RepID=A0A8H6FV01_9LECA|nr:uncharacterized protein HO173_006445 [Letharia columbiana]KAF6235251.1 hypothetical protein HO173_006445 [Letharia columbiana]